MLLPIRLALVLGFAACSATADPDATNTVRADVTEVPTLKEWMGANAAPALKSGNYEKLGHVFENVKTFAPQDSGVTDWFRIAASGAEAVKKHDMEGVREACHACHGAYRTAYRNSRLGR